LVPFDFNPLARVSPGLAPRSALMLLAGALQAASLAWPETAPSHAGEAGGTTGFAQPVWWLQLLAMALAIAVLRGRQMTPRQAGLLGWVFASAWLSGTFWWLFVSMHTYGGLPAPLAVVAVLLLAVALGAYYAVAAWMAVRWGRGRSMPAVWAAAWTLAELARGQWLSGFPWGAVGYAHLNGPLAALVPWIGAYGVGAWAVMVSASGVAAWHAQGAQRWATLGVAAGALVLPMLLLQVLPAHVVEPTHSTGSLSVALLQGNVAQNEKFQPGTGVADSLRWYGDQLLSRGAGAPRADVLIAPETALPVLPSMLPEGYWAALLERYASGDQAALIGMPQGSLAQGYTNSVVGLAPGLLQPSRYDKHHLVPFGEVTPAVLKWFTRLMHIPLGDFSRGALVQPGLAWKGQRIAPHVCYEDLFGEALAAQFQDPATAPTVMVNVSNIAWFGTGLPIDQHLHIARMRALELGRPMVRATNTGATVVIDHTGQVAAAAPRATRTVLLASVQGRSGLTPFVWWASRWGQWPVWLLAIAIIFIAANVRIKSDRRLFVF
jgi:apolipoprotein N-acyltransferase